MGNAKLKENDGHESFLDELTPGTELLQGQYKIEQFLNSGGFGITYLASDSLDRKVVIKECFPSSFCNRSRTIVQARSRAHQNELRSVVKLFVQEARSLAKLDHPNIVGVHQVFEDNETAYMVLDFVEGRDLLDTLEDGNHGLTAPQIKGILKDVLSAVQFIHEQDILHRDISPDNILLDADLRPVLIDFGAAREEATKKSRVLSAMRVVKDGYSPQEFYVQGSAQSPSSDLYALGATFYHLIVGEIPPNSQARLAAIAAGDVDPYEPLVGRIKGYDTKFLAAIDKSLGILPKDRVQSAEEWLQMMEGGRLKSRVLTQPAPVSSAAAETAAVAKRSKMVPLMGTAAVVAILAVGGLVATGNLSFSEDEAPASAIEESGQPVADAVAAVVAPVVGADAPASAVEAAPVETGVTETAPAPVETAEQTAPEADAPVVVAQEPVTTPEVAEELAIAEPLAPAFPAEVTEDAEVETLADTPATAEPVEEVTAVDAGEAAPVETAAVDTPDSQEVAPVVAEAAIEPEVAFIAPVIDLQEVGAIDAAPAQAETDFVPFGIDAGLADTFKTAPSIDGGQAEADAAPVVAAEEKELRLAALETIQPQEPVTLATPAPSVSPSDVAPAETVAPQQPVVTDAPVQSLFLVDLPFSGQPGSNEIAEAGIVSPVWVQPGAKIVKVNGVEVDDIADINQIAALSAPEAGAASLDLRFEVLSQDGTQTAEHGWTVPVIYQTALSNGLTFETRMIDDAWRTTVSAIGSASGDLKVGDQVVAYVPTSEALNNHRSIGDILERELTKGVEQFNFAVTRDGSMWVVSMGATNGA